MTEAALHLAMSALEAVRDHLVVVGGTAHRLFLLHPLGRDPGFVLLTTEDVDFAASLELQHDGSRELLDRLLDAGFTEDVRGAQDPAYVYPLRSEASTYLQFIANLTGTGRTRDGKRNRQMRFSGIHAEKLRHVDLLFHATWDVQLSSGGTGLRAPVVNPSAYLAQKMLKLVERSPAKRAKDLLYIFDTLAIFGDNLDELGTQAGALLPELSKKNRNTIQQCASTYCFRAGSTAQEASRIAEGQRRNPPTAAQIVSACAMALPRVLPELLKSAP